MYHVNLYLLESELELRRERAARRRRVRRATPDPYTPWLVHHRSQGGRL